MLLCSPGDKPFVNRSWEFCLSLPDPGRLSAASKSRRQFHLDRTWTGVAFCCAVWIRFSNWMFLALHNTPEGGELEWLWARVYHKLRRLSSQIQAALNLPHTSPPGQQREAEFLNILIQVFLRGQKVLEAHLFWTLLTLIDLKSSQFSNIRKKILPQCFKSLHMDKESLKVELQVERKAWGNQPGMLARLFLSSSFSSSFSLYSSYFLLLCIFLSVSPLFSIPYPNKVTGILISPKIILWC